jgi:CBS domain-containing protein
VINSVILDRAIGEGPADKRLADLVDGRSFPHVHLDHSLYWALERMGSARLELLPVVSRNNINNLEGVVTLAGVLRAYGVSPEGQHQGRLLAQQDGKDDAQAQGEQP